MHHAVAQRFKGWSHRKEKQWGKSSYLDMTGGQRSREERERGREGQEKGRERESEGRGKGRRGERKRGGRKSGGKETKNERRTLAMDVRQAGRGRDAREREREETTVALSPRVPLSIL